MKEDINDTLRNEGVEGVRARHDRARRYNGREDVEDVAPKDSKPLALTFFDAAFRMPVGKTMGN